MLPIEWRVWINILANKILKIQRKTIFSKNVMTENPDNTPFATKDFPSLIREEVEQYVWSCG